jgi:hypothetical protein
MDKDVSQTITERILLLGFLRILALNNMCEIFFGRRTDEEKDCLFVDLKDNFDGVMTCSPKVGPGEILV